MHDIKKDVKTFRFSDIAVMGFGFALGASFDKNALISMPLLVNSFISVVGCFLGVTPFYLTYYKLRNGYMQITNRNVIKNELLNYINKINYNDK